MFVAFVEFVQEQFEFQSGKTYDLFKFLILEYYCALTDSNFQDTFNNKIIKINFI